MSSENIHENHRERLRDMYLKGGFDSMAPHQILELMLFYAIARKDTNPLAHKLIDRFGSVAGVLDADPEALMTVDGVGKSTAAYLHMFVDVFRMYEMEKSTHTDQLTSVKDIGDRLRPCFIGAKNEKAFLLCLNSNMSVLSCDELSEGSINFTGIDFRKVVGIALRVRASFVVLAHNHPGATAIPSSADIATTRSVQDVLKELGIVLLDHLVFDDTDFVSMTQSGYISRYNRFQGV